MVDQGLQVDGTEDRTQGDFDEDSEVEAVLERRGSVGLEGTFFGQQSRVYLTKSVKGHSASEAFS